MSSSRAAGARPRRRARARTRAAGGRGCRGRARRRVPANASPRRSKNSRASSERLAERAVAELDDVAEQDDPLGVDALDLEQPLPHRRPAQDVVPGAGAEVEVGDQDGGGHQRQSSQLRRPGPRPDQPLRQGRLADREMESVTSAVQRGPADERSRDRGREPRHRRDARRGPRPRPDASRRSSPRPATPSPAGGTRGSRSARGS